MNRCVIIGGGPYKNPLALSKLLAPDDLIIAADSGWQLAVDMQKLPAILVADFDSMTSTKIPDGVKVITLPVEKDDTDTAVAMREGAEAGYKSFLLLGCTGGRLDHYHAALTIAAQYAREGCEVVLADEQNEIRALTPGEYAFLVKPGTTVSMFAFSDEVTDLSVDNLAYALNHFTLSPLNPLCVSNSAISDEIKIRFASGILLLYFSGD